MDIFSKEELKQKVRDLEQSLESWKDNHRSISIDYEKKRLEVQAVNDRIENLKDRLKEKEYCQKADIERKVRAEYLGEVDKLRGELTEATITLEAQKREHVCVTSKLDDQVKEKESEIRELDTLRHTEIGALKSEIKTLESALKRSEKLHSELLDKVIKLANKEEQPVNINVTDNS